MIRRPPISTRTDTLFPYTTLFRSFERVQSYIRAGDIYQANLTFPSTLPVPEDPRTLYVAIRGRAQAGHGGIVFTGAQWLLSFSPELFFTLESGRSEEHTSELQSLMRISYAVFCLKKKKK